MKLFPEIDYDESWIESASDDELRSASDRIYAALNEMDNDEDYASPEYCRLNDLHAKIVCATYKYWNGPKPREHGWYLPNDD